MDCVSYLKDRIRVRGHLRNGDMTNNARLEGEYLGVENGNAKRNHVMVVFSIASRKGLGSTKEAT